jgi:hypothetical protein
MYIKLARNRVLLLLSLLPFSATAQVLSNAQIEMVKQRLQQGATHRSAFSSSPTPVFALEPVCRRVRFLDTTCGSHFSRLNSQ